ncbi:MAG TPA: AraC family transcriptional regulator [Gemmatimonadales bacterium]|nr:AraC family transcriptional regulator [Gemmatimonadales bacterium]
MLRTVWRAGLQAYEAVYAAHSRLPEHEHTSPFFTYVLRGEFVEQVGTLQRHSARGAVIFHQHHDVHANIVGPQGTASLNVEITDAAWSELTSGLVPANEIVGRPLSGDAEWLALLVWREFHHDDPASTLGLAEAVALLCAEVKRSKARGVFEPHRRLDRCVEYLRNTPTARPSLTEVARIAGVHPIHLAKLFRKRFGYSMGEFLRRQRITWACEQLAGDSGTISAIAARAGFADHAHFTRTFRRLTGCSPRWYRRHVRGF